MRSSVGASVAGGAGGGVIWSAGRSIWASIGGKAIRLSESGEQPRTGQCVVVWRALDGLHTRGIDPSGSVLDAQDLVVPNAKAVGIATNGRGYLLLTTADVKTLQATLLHDGAVREILQLPGVFDYSSQYAVASNGRQSLIVTTDPQRILRIDLRLAVHSSDLPRSFAPWWSLRMTWTGRHDLLASNRFLVRIRADGSLVEDPIDTGASITGIATNSHGTAVIAYSRAVPEAPYLLARRVFTRTVSE